MKLDLHGSDHALLLRSIESVLLRFTDGKYSLLDTTEELAAAFLQTSRGDPAFLEHLRGIVEAGDDA